MISLVFPLAGACFDDAETVPVPELDDPGGRTQAVPVSGAPLATIMFPPARGLTDIDSITVRGVAADVNGVAAIRVNGVPATTSDGYATWQAVVPLAHGNNTIVVESEDTLGNIDPDAATTSVQLSRNRLRTASALGWDPVGERFVVADNGLQALLAVDSVTGARTVLSSASTGTGNPLDYMTSLAWDPVRGQMLVGDWGQHAVVAVDLGTGDRTVIASESVGTGPVIATPYAVTWDPVRNRALVVDADVDALLAVDLDTGVRTVISDDSTGNGPALLGVNGAAWDPWRERLLVVDEAWPALMAVDVVTGNRTMVSDASTGSGPGFVRPHELTLDPMGQRAIVSDLDADALFAVDLVTGDRTVLSNQGTGVGPRLIQPTALAWDPLHDRVINHDDYYDSLFAVQPVSGDRSVFSSFSVGAGIPFDEPDEMVRDAVGRRAFVISEGDDGNVLFEVDLRTGNRRLLSGWGIGAGPSLETPSTLIWDGPRQRVLVSDVSQAALLTVDVATGNRSVLLGGNTGTTFEQVHSMILDGMDPSTPADDRVLVLDHEVDALLAVDLATGTQTVISDPTTGTGPNFEYPVCMTWDPRGRRAFVFDNFQNTLFEVNLVTGDRHVIFRSEEEDFAAMSEFEFGDTTTIAWDAIHDRVFLGGESYASIPTIDLATGALEVLTGADVGVGPRLQDPYGLSYDPLRNVLLTVERSSLSALVAIDGVTGDRVILSR
jgi:hypothetical protein